jgi:hypothetical protein
MHREPPAWIQGCLAFFESLMYGRDNPHPILRRFADFSLLFLTFGAIYLAVRATTIVEHISFTLAAATYVAIVIDVWKRRQTKP